MRKTYEIGGMTFKMRTFTGRDVTVITGKLALLPTELKGGTVASVVKANDIANALLALCSKVPKLTLDEPDEIPEGTLPVSEIPDAIYGELVKQLCADSGWTAEAAEAVGPTSETGAAS